MSEDLGTEDFDEETEMRKSYPKVPCRRTNTPKCPAFKYGYPSAKKGVPEKAKKCKHKKGYLCPYIKRKLPKGEKPEDKEKGKMSDSEDLEEEQEMSERLEETEEQEPEEAGKTEKGEDLDAEKVELMARIAALEAREEERVSEKYELLLAEASSLAPDKKLDELLEPIEGKEARIAFLSKYINHMRELGFPIEEKRTELSVSKEESLEREELVCKDLFEMSLEEMEKFLGDEQ